MLTLAGLKTTQKLQGSNVVLGSAVQKNSVAASSPEEILAEYRKNIASISAYAVTVQNLNINIYGKVPDWYTEDFKEKFVNSKAHAQSWLNNIMSRLTEVPKSIIDYDDIYQMYSEEIVDYCRIMLKNPKKDLKKNLIEDLNKLIDSVSKRKDLIIDIESAIDDYISNLEIDKKFFDNIYASACETRDVDRCLLEDFKNKKSDLEKEIRHLQDVVTGTGIAGGVLLAAVPIGFAFGPVGIIIGVFVAAAAVANLLAAIIENVKCQQKESELRICINQMNEMTKTVQSLEGFCSELEKIISAAALAKSAAQEIKNLWNILEEQMAQLIARLENGEEDIQKELYTKLIKEVEDADNEWKEIVDTAKIYAQLNIEVQNTVIQVEKTA